MPKLDLKDELFRSSFADGLSDRVQYCKDEIFTLYSSNSKIVDRLIPLTKAVFFNPAAESSPSVFSSILQEHAEYNIRVAGCRTVLNSKDRLKVYNFNKRISKRSGNLFTVFLVRQAIFSGIHEIKSYALTPL